MIALETVEYWPKAQVEWEETYYQHMIPSFEQWLTKIYNCRITFSEFETSAAFVFDDPATATAFILKYKP